MDIPQDVWLYIAQFISEEDLCKMIAVNSAFYHLGMNARYRQVHLSYIGEKQIKLLVRLMDPEVATRVRSFTINPRIHRELVTDKNKSSTSDNDDLGRESLWKRSVHVLRKRVGDRSASNKRSHLSESEPARQYAPTLQGLEQALIDAVSCWSNLTEFSANWWEATPIRQFESFLPTAWSTFGQNLRTVSLGGNLATIRTLVSSAGPLLSLREFRLEFINNIIRIDDPADMATLVDVIAPFINGVSPTLESLSIFSWASIDLSEFFLTLGLFPLLSHFSIRAPFNKAFAINPDGFTRLLRNHSHSLTSITLRLNPAGSMIDPSSEETLCHWLTQTSTDPELILTNLTTIQIYPTLKPTGFDAFLTHLARSADTLTDLAIRDRYLTYPELESITSTLSHPRSNLTILRLNVRTLTLNTFDLLASTLPTLLRLSLYTSDTWREGGGGEGGGENAHPPDTNSALRTALRTRTYPNWKLNDIGIWVSGAEMDSDVMALLAASIPSLRSFWGLGRLSIA